MSTEDDQFVATGPDTGVEAGFLTRGANIDIGGHFEGRIVGLEAVCNLGGSAISATAVANNRAAVDVTNAGSGPGLSAFGSSGPGLSAGSDFGDAVVGLCKSKAHAGVSATNVGGGFGVWASGTPGGHFESNSGDNGGDAVVGLCKSNAHAGVSATNDSGGVGVWARGTPGGHFESNSGNGVHGKSNSPNDSGVWGENTSTSGTGVAGNSVGGFGVSGQSQNGTGVKGTSASRASGLGLQSPAIFGEHTAGGAGVWGVSSGPGSVGVLGSGDYGGDFVGSHAPLRLGASRTPGHPTSGKHAMGEFYVDSTGVLFYCLSAGTPGNWKIVHLV
jgi:hypothetical protein